jgi:hypothetical protein
MMHSDILVRRFACSFHTIGTGRIARSRSLTRLKTTVSLARDLASERYITRVEDASVPISRL